MKLAKIRIENFRHLGAGGKPFELDFTDPLGRVRDFTLLVGPNTSGKTTVLDAIAAALGPSLEMPTLRPGFKLSPRTVVSRGALQAKVTCWLRFDDEEIRTADEVLKLAELPGFASALPPTPNLKLTWIYPDTKHNLSGGWSEFDHDPGGSVLLLTRNRIPFLLGTGRVTWDWLKRAGGAFTFDQERTGWGKTISRQVWNIIHGTTEAAAENPDLRTTDPRTILVDLALQSLVPSVNADPRALDPFAAIRDRYADVCAPRRIVGAVRDELNEFSIRFSDGRQEYGYEGLSSGEKMLLLLVIRFVSEHIHRSVVLIDELELNQHPLWQRRLLHMIPRMGDNNQIIATTHSPYLRDAVPPDAVIELGGLGDDSRAEGA
ncbi:AAA family ATPase [Gemmata sp. JC673]|uniref:AAA family ATPase n=1 Tax=Gemmata algarum TaxID=2975278 RepID=A0ABU5F346_9BACT|nr:AAA family ATPase [Gemmata algarum]MDY3560294.1 AAA family ATPase [Gemmata algarum]